MATPQTVIEGTPLTIATVNDDWATAGTNVGLVVDVRARKPKAAEPTDSADLVFIQEGKRAKYADLVDPAAYNVQQDVSTKARAGSVVIRRAAAPLAEQAHGWLFLVRALGLLARYFAWQRLRVTGGKARGRLLLVGSAHRPPKRTARWWGVFDIALAARCRIAMRWGRLVIIGMDANQSHPEKLAKRCGLVWHSMPGYCIDGWLASPQIQFVDVQELPKATSDHHPLVAHIVIPKVTPKVKSKPWPTPFEHVIYNGRLMDQKTKAAVQAMERRLHYPLTIVQGCYNAGGVSASAGTHDAGGVVDFAPWDYDNKVRVGRHVGWFIWHRLPIPGVWGEHIHGGVRNHGNLSPAAAQQQHYFDQKPRRNGLAGEPVDPDQYPPRWPAPTFRYPPKRRFKE